MTQQAHRSECTKSLNTSKSFRKPPVHTHRSNPSITTIRVLFQHPTSHHMAQWVSNAYVTLATTPSSHPLVSHHQHCISGDGVCVVGFDKVECMMATNDGEVCHPQSHTTCVVSTMTMHSITPFVCLCCGLTSTIVMW